MKPVSLLSLALGGPGDFADLKTRIDLCAQGGHTCEFPGCLLLPGCTPMSATLGFWGDKLGYMMFLRPAVSYTGSNAAAGALFRSGRQGFPTFEGLAGFLRSLAGLSAPAPASRPQAAPAAPAPPAPPRLSLPALAKALGAEVLGQERAVEAVAFRLYAHLSKRAPARPLSLIFHGPTGVGKSELGKVVAPVLNRLSPTAPYQFVWTELNTFTEPHSVYRLTGAPPGYVGYDDKPVLEAVGRNPRTVFMFDELEKAHPEVLKTFMSILDEGRCAARKETPGQGRELDFRSCVFLFTTNADLGGSRPPVGFAAEEPQGVNQAVEDAALPLPRRMFAANEQARRRMAQGGCLKEIAGRFGGFVEFTPLSQEARSAIAEKQIRALGREYGLTVARVEPELVRAVMDQTGSAFSVRSHVGVIEGLFAPLFAENAQDHAGLSLRLEGTAERPRLVQEGRGWTKRWGELAANHLP